MTRKNPWANPKDRDSIMRGIQGAAKRRKSSQDEYRLHIAVADLLERAAEPDVMWTHFPAGERRDAITGSRLKRMGLKRGWADFIFVLSDGRPAFMEIKAGKGAQSDAQAAFQSAAEARGAFYEVARSIDEATGILRAWGVVKRARVAA